MKLIFDPVLLIWLGLLLVYVIEALALWRGRGADRQVRRMRARLLVAAGILALGLWLLEFTALPTRLMAGLETRHPAVPAPATRLDAVVVLGGGWSPSDRTGLPVEANDAFDRLLCGLDQLRRGMPGVGAVLVLGGAAGGDCGKTEVNADGEAARQWIGRLDLAAPPRVHVLPASRNTRDEARHVAGLVRERGFTNVGLVTSAWHMPRAMRTFAAAGVAATPLPCDFPASDELASRARSGPRMLPRLSTLVHLQRWITETLAGRFAVGGEEQRE